MDLMIGLCEAKIVFFSFNRFIKQDSKISLIDEKLFTQIRVEFKQNLIETLCFYANTNILV